MRQRFLAVALLSALTVVIAALWLARIPSASQAPATARTTAGTTAANTGTPLRTPWGEPELQGIWGQTTQTPLQRPKQFAGREFLTDEEVATLDQQRAALPGHEYRAAPGTDQDVAGAYNQVFASVKRSGKCTSLIVDPPDGRIPALTPEAQKRIAAVQEYESALLQGTSGGRAGPPSPRRAEAPPMYNVVRLNRVDGPEDRSLGERCLAGSLPDFNAFYRIVQSPEYVTIFYDTGQGQGFHRVNTRAAEKAFLEGRGPNPATGDIAMDGANTRDPAVNGGLDPLR